MKVEMSKSKQSFLFFRLVLVFIAMLAAYILSTRAIGEANINMAQEEVSQAGKGFIFVSLMNALVLSYLIMHSPWHGLKLIVAVSFVHFGVETFMAQIETLYFNNAVQMETAVLVGIIVGGVLRALMFAPLAVFILGKMKKPISLEENKIVYPAKWGWRFAALALLYVIVYFMFGYFVAWQWEETRLYYSGTTTIKPFFTHFGDLFLTEDPAILPFQLLRGTLWTFLTVVIVHMIKVKRWQASLVVALTFSVFLALPLGLFPNPYMPAMVAQSHFIEVSSSMLLFGGIAGWVMYAAEEGRGLSVNLKESQKELLVTLSK